VNNLTNIWKKTSKGFVKCRMFNLKTGDKFIYQSPERKLQMIATSPPYKNELGVWEIMTERLK